MARNNTQLLVYLFFFWSVVSLLPLMSVRWLVVRWVGWLVCHVISWKGWKLHFNASIGALVFISLHHVVLWNENYLCTSCSSKEKLWLIWCFSLCKLLQSYYFTADAKKWLNLTKEKKDILSIVDKPSWFNQLYIYSYTLNNLRTGPSPISNLWPSFLFRNPLRLSYYDLRSYWRFFSICFIVLYLCLQAICTCICTWT